VSGRLVALTTAGSAAEAERIARGLVERRLAACVSVVGGLSSLYRWKGRLRRDAETLLLIKTRSERFAALRRALLELHSYQVPELLALPVAAGHAAYLAWLDESVAAAPPARLRRRPGRARGPRSGRRRPRSRR
jgi:periplasmic divalent cation tolerance protein